MPGSNSTRSGSGSRVEACLVSLHEIPAEKLIDVNSDSKAGTSDRANGMVQGKLHVPPIRQTSSRPADKPARGRPERFRHPPVRRRNGIALHVRAASPESVRVSANPCMAGIGVRRCGIRLGKRGSAHPAAPVPGDQPNMPSPASLPASRIRAGKSGTTTLRGPSSPITPSRFRADICLLTVSMVRPR